MAGQTLSPALAAEVDRARRLAQEAGELLSPTPYAPPNLPSEVKAALLDWKASGDYDRAVAAIAGDDPDLATQ